MMEIEGQLTLQHFSNKFQDKEVHQKESVDWIVAFTFFNTQIMLKKRPLPKTH